MKIIDQYIYAIGQKLPLKGRNDVKEELKSLLLDDIEARFGKEPTEEEVSRAISDFGTPGQVARRYAGQRHIIAPGFTDLYFLIFRIMVFAMAVAFTTVFFVKLFTGDLSNAEVLKEIGMIVLNTITSSLSGIGTLTVVFIVITRFLRESKVDLEEDWTPKELKGIELGEEGESKIESFIGIFFLIAILTIVNFFPQLITMAEESFEKSGMLLGHRIDLQRFAPYIIAMSLVWISEIAYHIIILKTAVKTKGLKLFRLILDGAAIVVLMIMVLDKSLFIANPEATMPSLIGFKAVFLLVLLISSIELLVQAGKSLIKAAEKKMQ